MHDMELLQVLEKTLAPDQNELQAANQYLANAAAENLPQLLTALSDILKNGGNSLVARMQAGIQLKNHLYSKDFDIRNSFHLRWLGFPDQIRNYIKSNVLATLGSETRPSQAAQCVASIACAELPNPAMWPDLIQNLVSNVTNASSTEMMREASLETIGYICQDIDPEHLQTQSNQILTAIVHGMKKDETSDYVRLAATNALINSLEFTKANFENTSERNFIMQVVCEATQSTEPHVKVAALQCLVKIMSLHYVHMESYMGQALFAISLEAMKSDADDTSLQGIEFWSTVCDEEVDLGIELQEAEEMGRTPERVSMHYAKSALPYLVPILTEIMTKQENETEDDDEWNPCKAAGVSLMLLATCCEDDIVEPVLTFVSANIGHAEWSKRDAAIMAFGSILEGPDSTKMKPIMNQAMPGLIGLLRDPSPAVRDSAAWTVGRVCEILPETAISDMTHLVPLVEGLVAGLDDVPRVSANAAWAFSSLAEAAYELAAEQLDDDTEEPATYCLSQCFAPVVEKLLLTTERADGNQNNLRSAAYEALMELVKNSPKDCYEVVKKTTLIILERLQRILQMEAQITSSNDRTQYNDLQSLLCATLQSVVKKVTKEDIPQISETIMQSLLHMLHISTTQTVQPQGDGQPGGGGVQEDALLAVSALVEKLGADFIRYMESFKPYLLQTLRNTAEYSVCLVATNCVGDLYRALQTQMKPFTDEIMQIFLSILQNNNVDRQLKPSVLSVFGDIALAMGPEFKIYLDLVANTLGAASQLEVDRSDYDLVDYLNELRESCLEAYTGIIQGLKGENGSVASEVNLLLPHAQSVVDFIERVSKDQDRNDAVLCAACGLIGDLAMAFGQPVATLAEKESITNMLQSARKSKTSKTKTIGVWATKELKKLKPDLIL